MATLTEPSFGTRQRFTQRPTHRHWRRIASNWSALISLLFLIILSIGALGAPILTPYGLEGLGSPNMINKLLPPSFLHLMGTDEMGRDLLARILFGSRYSLPLAAIVIGISLMIGIAIGLVAGYIGGWFDEIAMRITDVFLAFPPLLLAILFVTVLGGGFTSTVLALVLTWWPWYTRLIRSQVLALRQRPFIEAARSIGITHYGILLRHLLPNALTPVLVQATIDIGAAILTVAGLSFIGLGPPPPTADWGGMLASGRAFLLSGYWWPSTFPGLMITLTGLACALVGDRLRRATNE